MLEYIRNNSQSWGVKIAFGIIILVFIFWGLGSMQSINNSGTIVKVNGEAISVVDFDRAYQSLRARVQQENPQITPEQIKQMQLPAQVLDQLILQSLLQEEVARLHMSVPPQILRDAIMQMPAFQNAEGVFDPAAYKRAVETQFPSVGAFEALVREQLLETKLRQEVTLTAQSFSSEIDAFFDYTNEKRDIEYVFFPAADTMGQVQEPAADSVKTYYESNRAAYTVPAKGDVEFVSVTPTTIAKPESVSPEAVASYYEKNKTTKYTRPAQVKASHILLSVEPQADEDAVQKVMDTMKGIEQELKDGADFAELAKKHSKDPGSAPNGGDLGWFATGMMVPEFEKAISELEDGQLSGIVRTSFGLHLIKKEGSRPESIQAQAEVEPEIRKILSEEAALLRIRETLDVLIEANVLGKGLAEGAKAQGLTVTTTGLQTATELEKSLKITPEQAAKVLALSKGVPLDTAMQTTDDGYIVARMGQKNEATVRPFEEVQGDIVIALKEREALEKALANAATARKAFAEKEPEASLIQTETKIGRSGSMKTLGTQAELLAAAFTADAGQWLPSAYAVTFDGKPGAVLVRVKAIHSGALEDRGPLAGALVNVISNEKAQNMFELFLETLRSRAKVEIVNGAYLDAVAANQ